MKTSMLLLFLIGFQFLQAQEAAVKKANTIIISNDFSLQNNIKQVTEILFESGYGVHNSDMDAGIISTTEKSFKNGSVKLNILVRDQKITIRGDFKTNISLDLGGVIEEDSWTMIQNSGGKNSPYRNAWDSMNNFALLLPGEKYYEIK